VGDHDPTRSEHHPPERYEPLPGVAELPGWVWRKMGRFLRIAVVVALLVAIATAAALVPELRESKQERAQAEQRERAERRAQLVRELEAEQRPRFGRSSSVASTGAGEQRRLEGRAGLMDELSATIVADARSRVRLGQLDGPIRRVECDPFPRTVDGVGADRDLSRRRGRYACLAVTAEFGRGEASVGGVIGHQYRALVDFETGRYGYCKISGQAGPSREQLATTPRACGGS
jgi:hypothetical protein